MEPSQGHGGMIWYEGILASTASGTPVQVELGSDISRQLNQPVQIQYGNFQSIPSQSQHIIVAHQPIQEINSQNVEVIKPHKANKPRPVGVGERVPCSKCGKTFSCNANLRDHLRLHTGERPFSCTECGMQFAQRSNWRLHKRVHTGERPYMCGICGKTFARSTHLPGHMRVHTGERPFNCESCEHTFASAQALKNHVRTHTGEKPFMCESCQTSFTHSSSLSSHKKRCNGEKRKRGRPLGSGHRFYKKKTPGRRGRPRKRGKFIKRGRKKIKEDPVEEFVFDVDDKCIEDTKGKTTTSFIKFETATGSIISAEGIPEEHDMMEISMEVISQVAPERPNEVDVEIAEVKPNENDGVSILPDRGEVIVTDDMVQAAANAAGLANDNADLHQEAALTMATLQHGDVNLIQSDVNNDVENSPQTTTWYLKQE